MKTRNWLLGLAVLMLATLPVAAQEAPAAELFGGYSYLRVTGNGEAGNLHGWNAALQANVTSAFALVADFGGHYDSDQGVDVNVHTFLFGPQVTARGERVSVFGRTLFGAGRAGAQGFGIGAAETAFAFAAGGGLDVRLAESVSLRLIQADYLLTRFGDSRQNNARISTGLVFRLGR